jgi:uncharacterized repeat protein (TIGR01451 family)
MGIVPEPKSARIWERKVMAQHLRVSLIAVCLIALLTSRAALGQFQNIPPTRVPETSEPQLADPTKKNREVPDYLRREILLPAGTPAPPPGAPAPVQTPGDPPTPYVSIHVSAPANGAIGNPLVYTITIENRSQAPAHHVKVTNPLTPNLEFTSAEPTPTDHSTTMLTWKFETLKPGESRTIKLELTFKGDDADSVENVARVSFEHGQKVKTSLQRPKLTLKKLSNQYGVENQPVICRLIVENNGPVDVVDLVVRETLGDGLEFEAAAPAGKKAGSWRFARVKAGGKEEQTYNIVPRKAGELQSTIEASDARGVVAKEKWLLHSGKPPLSVKLTGPELANLNKPATYQIAVKNSGAIALDNVAVAFALTQGMFVERATLGGQPFAGRVQWSIGQLNAGETRNYDITVRAKSAGRVPNFVTVHWRGPELTDKCETEFLGAAAPQLSTGASKSLIAVGEKVTYTMTITNRGTTPARDVKLLAQFPISQFELVMAESDGKRNARQELEIGPLSVQPGESVTKRIVLKAVQTGAAARIHVEMSSPDLPSGNVSKDESATVVAQ